jgi:hypothetical protein
MFLIDVDALIYKDMHRCPYAEDLPKMLVEL